MEEKKLLQSLHWKVSISGLVVAFFFLVTLVMVAMLWWCNSSTPPQEAVIYHGSAPMDVTHEIQDVAGAVPITITLNNLEAMIGKRFAVFSSTANAHVVHIQVPGVGFVPKVIFIFVSPSKEPLWGRSADHKNYRHPALLKAPPPLGERLEMALNLLC
jgi:hypothetical protein